MSRVSLRAATKALQKRSVTFMQAEESKDLPRLYTNIFGVEPQTEGLLTISGFRESWSFSINLKLRSHSVQGIGNFWFFWRGDVFVELESKVMGNSTIEREWAWYLDDAF